MYQTADNIMSDCFTVRMASVTMNIVTSHPKIRPLFRDYIISPEEGDADFTVEAAEENIEIHWREYQRMYGPRPPQTRYLAEFLELQALVTEQLNKKDIYLMHGSVLSLDGQGYLFTAPSGTGKSTHSRLWREYFGGRVCMVNDDKPFVCIRDQEMIAYGTPWNGKHNLSTNISVPVRGICYLRQAKENHIHRLSRWEGMQHLYAQLYRARGKEQMQKSLDFIDRILEIVPIYELSCNMEPEAVEVAYRGMTGKDSRAKRKNTDI